MKFKMPSSYWLLAGGLWLGLLLLVALAYLTALQKLGTELKHQLPEVVNKALEDHHGFQQKAVPYLLEQLNADLALIPIQPASLLISHCSATLSQIGEGAAPKDSQAMQWLSGTHQRFASVELQCTVNSAGIAVIATVVMLLLVGLLWFVPAPVSMQREKFIAKAVQSGADIAEALALTVPLQGVVVEQRLLFLNQLLEQHFSLPMRWRWRCVVQSIGIHTVIYSG